MKDYGLFKPRHPVTGDKRQQVEWVNPTLFGPVIADEPSDVNDEQKFQHIECGAIHVTEDILAWGKNCTHCQSDSIVSQFQIMELVESPYSICDAQRYAWLKKAIVGFQRNGRQQSATLALRQMFSRKEFQRLINIREYGKDISLIEFAIWQGDGNALLILIQNGAQVNTSSFLMRTPLHFAVEKGRHWAVVQLLEHGADPEATHLYAQTPAQLSEQLMRTARTPEERGGYVGMNNLFKITRPVFGSSLDQKEKQHGNRGENHLHFAVRTLNEDGVFELLTEGVNPNLPDNSGFNPLMCMFSPLCFDDGTLSLQFFKAALHARYLDLSEEQFVYYFCFYLQKLINLNLLTRVEEGVYRVNYHNFSAEAKLEPWLIDALHVTRHVNIARLLFERTDLSLLDNSHKTVFYHAVNTQNARLCLELFKLGLRKDPDFFEYCCNVMIHMFLDPRTQEPALAFQCMKLFLDCCQKIANSENNWSVLHLAVRIFPETPVACAYLSWLVYCKAPFADSKKEFVLCQNDIDACDDHEESPLFWAIRRNKFEFVKQLAKDGACFTLQNHYGEFAFEVAEAIQPRNEAMIVFVRQKSFEAIEEGPQDNIEEELQSRLYIDDVSEEQLRLVKRYKQEQAGEESSEYDEEEQGDSGMEISDQENDESEGRLESPRPRR